MRAEVEVDKGRTEYQTMMRGAHERYMRNTKLILIRQSGK